MIFDYELPERSALRQAVSAAYRADETACVERLLEAAAFPDDARRRIAGRAEDLVKKVRLKPKEGGVEALMYEYELSSHEGIVLMCLAEALLRVPDAATVDRLINDKITSADWRRHLGHSDSLFVNASTWAFMLTGDLLAAKDSSEQDFRTTMTGLLGRTGEPVIRRAVTHAMKLLGRQFIMGATIDAGLERARAYEKQGYRFSYDMLGEAARTNADAEYFFGSYSNAINRIGAASKAGPIKGPGLSVKLSALDPRYSFSQYERTMEKLLPKMQALARLAKEADIGLTIDAEEADRLELKMDILEALAGDPDLAGWNGLGLAIQAYQKRTYFLCDWLIDLARRTERRLMVRLVKGAYWDTEIKRSQEQGLQGYPVFTRKASTDVSYIACAKKLVASPDAIFPQFATHNAQSIAVILELMGGSRDFEFQRLTGMGEPLYGEITPADKLGIPCRVYAPCGGHKELLPYLVRRLLENGANTSFVNRIMDESIPITQITADPVETVRQHQVIPHPNIPLPRGLYGSARDNSTGLDLSDEPMLRDLAADLERHAGDEWRAQPIVGGAPRDTGYEAAFDPSDRRRQVGQVALSGEREIADALARAEAAAEAWRNESAEHRAACLEKAAELYEANMAKFMAICVREAGKSIVDAVAEVREAVDFCRWYALRARRDLAEPVDLPGGNGQKLRLAGRGPFVCISPWNFPLAIFTGQIVGALVAGNPVIAKPAEQTPLIAAFAVSLLHQAGIPGDVLQLIPGDGRIGAALVADPRVKGVAFTGSTEAAHSIRRTLADGKRGIAPLIAETGGQNGMIVDSTALPEQTIEDVLRSAFDSAGQRCSALRVLFVQEDVAPGIIKILSGAMSELRVGDPSLLKTDVGPVIDQDARTMLINHAEEMSREGKLIHVCELTPECAHGTYFAPRAYEIDSLSKLKREVFGPFLHVVRFQASRINKVIEAVNGTGFGLTFGLHSRIDSRIDYVFDRVEAGNIYVNRNIVGAVVGVQPFGGEGLSGTGPKAGGLYYLHRFTTGRTDGAAEPDGADGGAADGAQGSWSSVPIVGGHQRSGPVTTTHAAGDSERISGTIVEATTEHVDRAFLLAKAALFDWRHTPVAQRAAAIGQVADRLAQDPDELIAIAASEAGLARPAAERQLETAAALCRSLAAKAKSQFGPPISLQGPTGERDEVSLHARGIFLCAGAGDRPVVELMGHLSAVLLAGNGALLMPDETALHLGGRLVWLLQQAGVPSAVLHYLPTTDGALRDQVLADPRLAGVAYAGPETDALALDAALAARPGAILPLIARITGDGACEPWDLYRYGTERSLSVDTTASGGNASLFAMGEGDR